MPPGLTLVIKEHRKRQNEAALRAGPKWPGNPLGLVFLGRTGAPLDGISVGRHFQRRLQAAGARRVTFHTLRHGAATMLLPLQVVSRTLGHSQVSVTADSYAHAVAAIERETAEHIAAVLDRLS